MLALTLKPGHSLTIGQSRIVIAHVGSESVKLAITAARELPILRYDAQGVLLHDVPGHVPPPPPRQPMEPIDWPAAAEQLLAVLSSIAARSPGEAAGRRHAPTVRTCRVCGCTDENCSQCVNKTGEPCSWIEADLCSACVGILSGAYRPVLAGVLCRLAFGVSRYRNWDHETRRRRVRDAVLLVRTRLTADQAKVQIAADCHGYWLSSDPATLARYAALRRRHAISELVAAKDLKANIAAAGGQTRLFNATPTERMPR